MYHDPNSGEWVVTYVKNILLIYKFFSAIEEFYVVYFWHFYQ